MPGVIARFAKELIAPRAAAEHVIAFAAIEQAVASRTGEQIIARRTVKGFAVSVMEDIELGQHIIHIESRAIVKIETVDALPTGQPILDAHRIA